MPSLSRTLRAFAASFLILLAPLANATSFQTAYRFPGGSGGSEAGGLAIDSTGVIYGASDGGVTSANVTIGRCPQYCGQIFSFNPAARTITPLHNFIGGAHGFGPSYLTFTHPGGALFGETDNGPDTVFKFTPASGYITTLYTFKGGADGSRPYAPLVADAAGNLYGVTDVNSSNSGTIYKIDPKTNLHTVLYAFTSGSDGIEPGGSLAIGQGGILYGVMTQGGVVNPQTCQSGCGTLFGFNLNTGILTTLHYFASGPGTDGWLPQSGLVMDSAGNLYGTTLYSRGGTGGTIYKFNPATNILTTLYTFPNGTTPQELVKGKSGGLFGSTVTGGANGQGSIFKVNLTTGAFKTLYSLAGTDGVSPHGLAIDQSGNIYGATYGKTTGSNGTLFKLIP